MAYSKKDEFSTVDVQIANFAKSMAHPARIAILKLLAEKTKSTCGEIVEKLPLSQASVSRHLDELKIAGLVIGKPEGTKITYTVHQENCKKAMDFFGAVFRIQKANSERVDTPSIADVLMSGHKYRVNEGVSYAKRW